jgi:hypothetical protein
MRSVVYARELFDLQLTFAERVQALSGLPLEQVLFEYTNLFVRFGFGRDLDPQDERWQAYLAGLREAADPREWTYRFYLRDPETKTAPEVVATFGCFSYAALGADRIRLHFHNAEPDGVSPLCSARTARRQSELATLFQHVAETRDDPEVVGVSWLYNIDAYRRLFPPAYVITARVLHDRFQSMPLWGQFVDRHGCVKEALREPFLTALNKQSGMQHLDACFPLPVLATHAPVSEFRDFYEIA